MKFKNLIVLLLGLLLFSSSWGRVVEKIVAVVNDQMVTKTDVENFRKKLQSDGLLDRALLDLRDSQQLLASQDKLVNHLIDEKILDSEVKKRGLQVPIEKVESEIRKIAAQRGLSRSQLKTALNRQGISFSKYQEFVRTSLERQALIKQEITSNIRVTDEDIASYYTKNMGGSEVYEYKLAHIMFLYSEGGRTEAKSEAQEVLQKIGKSRSFGSLARQYSEDPNFSAGGLLGTVKANDLSNEMRTAVKNLSVGGVSGIVEGPAGYHIIKLLDKNLVENPELKRKKKEIHNILFSQAFKRQLESWLREKRQEVFIRVN